MVVHYVSHLSPLIKSCLPDQLLAALAKILDLSLIRVTDVANIFKMDVDDEVLWNDLVFVFANIFWAKLHLSSLDIIASLDKGSIEHYSEQDLIGETSMFKNDLDVVLHHK